MISPENARLQAQRVADARGMTLDQVMALVHANTTGRSLGFLGEPGVNVLELNLALDRTGVAFAHGKRRAPCLPRRRRGRRQDVRNAERGPTSPRYGEDVVVGFVETHGREKTARQVGDLEVVPRQACRISRRHVRGDGRRRPARAKAAGRACRRVRAHECPGIAEREALAGRRRAARGRHHGHHDAEHPAPRVAERRRRADHGGQAAGDDPGRRRARGGRDPARRPHAARAQEPPGAG